MKEQIHKIMSIFMAVVVMLSTMSFTVGMHYCGGNLVDVALFKQADTCSMKIASFTSECEVMKKNCCTDEMLVLEGQDELKLSFESLDYNDQMFLTSFVYTYFDLFEGLEEHIIPFKNYIPPLVVRDIQVLDEVYLI